MSWVQALILLPFLTSILCSLIGSKHTRALTSLSLTGAFTLVLVSFFVLKNALDGNISVIQASSWPAPFAITLVVDLFSSVMVGVASIIGFFVLAFISGNGDDTPNRRFFHTTYHILIAALMGLFITGDLFNLYVWLEVLLMSSFVLMAFKGGSEQLRGTFKYLALNVCASLLILTSIGLLYTQLGSLNLAHLNKLSTEVAQPTYEATLTLLIFGIAAKTALFPLFLWLPDSYPVTTPGVTALFGGLLTKAGIYMLFRIYSLLVTPSSFLHSVLLVVSLFSMLIGVFGAVSNIKIRNILSIHVISQMGYITLGLALFSHLSMSASIYYVLHITIVKTALFLVAGLVLAGFKDEDLNSLGDISKTSPMLSLLFFISALSLAGIPPFSGFFAKLSLLQAAMDSKAWISAGFIPLVSLLTLYSMHKIWRMGFLAPPCNEESRTLSFSRPNWRLWAASTALMVTGVALGLWADRIFVMSQLAASQLLNPAHYITAVLGGAP